jgi:hypothetical protein
MVIVVDSFDVVKSHYDKYYLFIRVFYSSEVIEGKEYVRITAGEVGWRGPLTEEIKKWLSEVKAVRVVEAIPDELFFAR